MNLRISVSSTISYGLDDIGSISDRCKHFCSSPTFLGHIWGPAICIGSYIPWGENWR